MPWSIRLDPRCRSDIDLSSTANLDKKRTAKGENIVRNLFNVARDLKLIGFLGPLLANRTELIVVVATWHIRSEKAAVSRIECCTGYLGYPFQSKCADDELHPYLFLFIHRTGKLFYIALYSLILERISK